MTAPRVCSVLYGFQIPSCSLSYCVLLPPHSGSSTRGPLQDRGGEEGPGIVQVAPPLGVSDFPKRGCVQQSLLFRLH